MLLYINNIKKKMNRSTFINYFEKKYTDNFSDYYKQLFFDIDLSSFDNNKIMSELYINSLLQKDFEVLGINSDIKIPKDILNVDFDYDYNEDENNTSELIRHNLNINLNILFDHVIEQSPHLNNSIISIYRIEHSKGGGLYDGIGFSVMSKSADNIENHTQPCPSTENSFMSIFEWQNRYIPNDYKRSWHFAFSSVEQLKKWVHSNDTLEELKFHGYNIYEISIPESAVISGDNQTIFKSDKFLLKKLYQEDNPTIKQKSRLNL